MKTLFLIRNMSIENSFEKVIIMDIMLKTYEEVRFLYYLDNYMKFGRSDKENLLENLTPNVSIFAVLDKSKSNVQFILYVKTLSPKKVLGKVIQLKTTLPQENIRTYTLNEYVMVKIHKGKLNILKDIAKNLNPMDQINLIRNRYAFLPTKPPVKTAKETMVELMKENKRCFQSVKLYPILG